MSNGNDRQPGEAEEAKENKEKADEKRPPQVEPEGTTGDPATPPDRD